MIGFPFLDSRVACFRATPFKRKTEAGFTQSDTRTVSRPGVAAKPSASPSTYNAL